MATFMQNKLTQAVLLAVVSVPLWVFTVKANELPPAPPGYYISTAADLGSMVAASATTPASAATVVIGDDAMPAATAASKCTNSRCACAAPATATVEAVVVQPATGGELPPAPPAPAIVTPQPTDMPAPPPPPAIEATQPLASQCRSCTCGP